MIADLSQYSAKVSATVRYQRFVFFSYCRVLYERRILEPECVYEVMRTIIKGDEKYLKSVLKGNGRMNQVIFRLVEAGWTISRATTCLCLCK